MIKDIISANETITPNDREVAVLREHFPACFKDDGSFDIERFREYLCDKVHVTSEGYELKFLGKNYARLLAALDTTTVVQPDEKHNAKSDNTASENIYISGDNLDALKHLLKSYARQVKCIYIDPPYNTGSDGFIYNDNFSYSTDELALKLSISEEQAQRILDLTKRGSATDSAWLMFMYSRLQLARDLLARDGAIFISIDDYEQANLKLLCDDIFGIENFAGQIAIVNNLKGRNSRANIATTHEYLLVYVTPSFISGGIPLTEEQKAEYQYTDENGNKYALRDLRKRGGPDKRNDRPNMWFPIYYNRITEECSLGNADGLTRITPLLGDGKDGRWRWGKDHVASSLKILHPRYSERTQKWNIDHRVYLNPSLNPVIEDDEFDELEERTANVKSYWQGSSISTDMARRTLKVILPNAEFDYPKSVDLIKRILHMSTYNDSVILDFFSGSATTAQAVMEMNTDDKGARTFILVQLPEDLDARYVRAKGESLASLKKNMHFLDTVGRPHTLDQIGIERIICAAQAIKEAYPDTTADLGFKHYTLVEPSEQTLDKMFAFEPKKMFPEEDILKQFGKPTVLTTWLNYDGYGLNAAVETLDLGRYTAYRCKKHLYLIDPNFGEDALVALMAKYESDGEFSPNNVVLFGYSFVWRESEMLNVNLKRLKDTEKNLRVNLDIRY